MNGSINIEFKCDKLYEIILNIFNSYVLFYCIINPKQMSILEIETNERTVMRF